MHFRPKRTFRLLRSSGGASTTALLSFSNTASLSLHTTSHHITSHHIAHHITSTSHHTSMASSIRAIVLGGSGNVGSRVVAECVKSEAYTDITVLSRRPLPEYDNPAAHQNKVKVHVVSSFDDIETIDLSKHNAAFMLMGIGQPSKASQQDLQKIDCDIPVSFATACHKSGIEHMSVLSSVGANPTQEYSWVTRTGAGG